MIAAMALVLAAATIAIGYAVATIERHRAGAAADAAALAAALDAVRGPAAACQQATRLATLDRARLSRCTVSGSIADVSVTVGLPGLFVTLGPATGRARAGPVGAAAG
jgi:secretion/DNA translocation related TadE-like protein